MCVNFFCNKIVRPAIASSNHQRPSRGAASHLQDESGLQGLQDFTSRSRLAATSASGQLSNVSIHDDEDVPWMSQNVNDGNLVQN
jgi:hypothetical protein